MQNMNVLVKNKKITHLKINIRNQCAHIKKGLDTVKLLLILTG